MSEGQINIIAVCVSMYMYIEVNGGGKEVNKQEESVTV